MKNSKLIQILKSFSASELKEFEKFLESPFFKCKKFVSNYFKELIKFYPEFGSDDIESKKIFRKLYGDKKYNDGLIRRMASDITGYSEEFMMYNSFRETQLFRDTCLLHELRLRKLDKAFELKAKKITENINKISVDNSTSLHRFLVENQKINFFLKNDPKKLNESIVLAADSFISFFLSSLNNKKQLIDIDKIVNEKVKPELYINFLKSFDYQSFINSVESVQSDYSFFIMTDYYFNRLKNDDNDKDSYEKLRDIFRSKIDHFSGITKYNFIIILNRYCTNRIEHNHFEYLDEYFEYISILLNEKLFLQNSSTFNTAIIRTMILFSLIRKDYKPLESFMNEYSQYFHPGMEKMIYDYYRAMYLFEKKDFEKSLECTVHLHFDSNALKRDIKFLRIKIFYELEYFDMLYNEVDAVKHFIANTKNITDEKFLLAENFLIGILKLAKFKEKKKIGDLFFMKNHFKGKNYFEKIWIDAKLNEFKEMKEKKYK